MRDLAFMKTMQRLIRFLLVVILIALTLVAPQSALSQATIIRAEPIGVPLNTGQTLAIAIRVENVTNLYAFDLEVHFNTAQLDVTSVVIGSFLDQGIKFSSIDRVNGIVEFANTQNNPATPKTGSGDLIVITVQAKTNLDAVYLTITSAELSDRDGYLIPCQIVNDGGFTYKTYLPLIIY
jgi:hypothetical protein